MRSCGECCEIPQVTLQFKGWLLERHSIEVGQHWFLSMLRKMPLLYVLWIRIDPTHLHLLGAGHCSTHFTWSNSVNSSNSPVQWVLLLSPLCRWQNRGIERAHIHTARTEHSVSPRKGHSGAHTLPADEGDCDHIFWCVSIPR